MPDRMIEKPPHRVEFLEQTLARLDAFGVDPAATGDLRVVLESLEEVDPDMAALVTNPAAGRDRITRALREGSMTVEQAREQLVALTARAAADAELAKVLELVRGDRVRKAWTAAGAVDWYGALVPVGQAAAEEMDKLAGKLPTGTNDSTALRASEAVRKTWLTFGKAVARWLEVVHLLDSLRWNGLADIAPMTVEQLRVVDNHRGMWRWCTDHLASMVATDTPGRDSTDPATLLAYMHAAPDMRPGVPTPAQVARLFEARERLRDASPRLTRMAWPVPGADVPLDRPQHKQVAALVGR